MANILTGLRIFCSIILLFFRPFSVTFYVVYITAGITDILDGIAARRLNTVSDFGSKFDTAADICFAAACLYKLIPVLNVPVWLRIWIAAIAIIKAANIVCGFVICKTLISAHTVMNKIVGFMLFVFPLILPIVDFRNSAFVLCVVASFSAIQEGIYIKRAI